MEKTTEWALGQPLLFPTKGKSNETNRPAREVVDPAIGEPLTNPIRRPDGVDDTLSNSSIARHVCRSQIVKSGSSIPNRLS